MDIGIQFLVGKFLVTFIEVLDFPGRCNGRLPVQIRGQVYHAGIGVPVNDRVTLLLDHAPGVLDDGPADRRDSRTDLPVEKPETV